MKRVLITGSRTWSDWDRIREALTSVRDSYGIIREDIVVVHGDARGADRMAGRIATELGMKVEHHPADWQNHDASCRSGCGNGKGYCQRAGYRRNAEMVLTQPDLCLAFIKDGSRGATQCAELAEKAGIPVLRYLA